MLGLGGSHVLMRPCHPDKSLDPTEWAQHAKDCLLRHVEPLYQEPACVPPVDQVQRTAMNFEAASKWLQSTLQRKGSVEIEAYVGANWSSARPSAKTGAELTGGRQGFVQDHLMRSNGNIPQTICRSACADIAHWPKCQAPRVADFRWSA